MLTFVLTRFFKTRRIWEQIVRFVSHWRLAGSLDHPTAETQECYEAVIDILTDHVHASTSYKTRLSQWQDKVKKASNKAMKKELQGRRPEEPTSKGLKAKLGTELLQKFPSMSVFRHMYKNLLQVNLCFALS